MGDALTYDSAITKFEMKLLYSPHIFDIPATYRFEGFYQEVNFEDKIIVRYYNIVENRTYDFEKNIDNVDKLYDIFMIHLNVENKVIIHRKHKQLFDIIF